MTFNVQNLFDTRHDVGKNDYTFLPRSEKDSKAHRRECQRIPRYVWRKQCLDWDWSEAVLETKLRRLAKTILQVGNGRGPDLLALQEVENRAVLTLLQRGHLAVAGYRTAILIEGHDYRGIDVAFLSRFPVVGSPQLHPIPFSSSGKRPKTDARGILQAKFKLPGGAILTAFNLHLPAPFHPAKMRVDALKFLNTLRETLPANALAVAMGDFNITSKEASKTKVIDNYAQDSWIVAHQIGCRNCRGTTYYAREGSWSFLDMIWLSNRMDPRARFPLRWVAVPESVAVANHTAAQKTTNNTPARFNLDDAGVATGVSDHWPLIIRLMRR